MVGSGTGTKQKVKHFQCASNDRATNLKRNVDKHKFSFYKTAFMFTFLPHPYVLSFMYIVGSFLIFMRLLWILFIYYWVLSSLMIIFVVIKYFYDNWYRRKEEKANCETFPRQSNKWPHFFQLFPTNEVKKHINFICRLNCQACYQ